MTLGIDSMAANGTLVEITNPPTISPGGELELGDGFVSNKVLVPNGSGTKLEIQIAKTGATRLEGTIHIEGLFNNRTVSLDGTITIDY
jgi:hypothetical protein